MAASCQAIQVRFHRVISSIKYYTISTNVLRMRALVFHVINFISLECLNPAWTQKDGYFVLEGHGDGTECYGDLNNAKSKCMAAEDCHAIAAQSNICGGQYRVTHGGPTFKYWKAWQSVNLRSWERTCTSKSHN